MGLTNHLQRVWDPAQEYYSMDVSELQVTYLQREQINKGIEITRKCFSARATDGKISNKDAMPVFVAIMEEYQEVEILQQEKLINEGIKENLEALVGQSDLDKDGFLDWDEYMALLMEARSTFTLGLFTKFDLNGDGEIDQLRWILLLLNSRTGE